MDHTISRDHSHSPLLNSSLLLLYRHFNHTRIPRKYARYMFTLRHTNVCTCMYMYTRLCTCVNSRHRIVSLSLSLSIALSLLFHVPASIRTHSLSLALALSLSLDLLSSYFALPVYIHTGAVSHIL